jgi:hypothetical protein
MATERGKGDHCHIFGEERAYEFKHVAQLTEDFLVDVDKLKKGS